MTTHQRPILEPTTQAFIDALNAKGAKPLYELSYGAARNMLEDAQAGNVKTLPADVESLSQRSYEEFANGPWLTTAAMEWFWDAYAPNKADRRKITAAPLTATTEQLKGLPPALVIVDENDPLRDEGEAYARKLIQSGVDVTAVRVLATVHDFAMLNALAGTPAARVAIQLAAQKLEEALGRR